MVNLIRRLALLVGVAFCALALATPASATDAIDVDGAPVDNGDGTYTVSFDSFSSSRGAYANSFSPPNVDWLMAVNSGASSVLESSFSVSGLSYSVSSFTDDSYSYRRASFLFPMAVSSGASLSVSFNPVLVDFISSSGVGSILDNVSFPVCVSLFDVDKNLIDSIVLDSYVSNSSCVVSFPSVSAHIDYMIISLYIPISYVNSNWSNSHVGVGFSRDNDSIIVVTTFSTATTGLLNGIIDMLQSIVDAVEALPDTLSNIVSAISSLPDLIITGIYNLFIPSEESLQSLYDDFQALLSEHLGAVWQVFDVVFNIFNSLIITTDASTIDFPGITVNLPEGSFVLVPASSVSIVPSGFDAFFAFVRIGVTAIIVFAWLRGLMFRLSVILGGEGGSHDS